MSGFSGHWNTTSLTMSRTSIARWPMAARKWCFISKGVLTKILKTGQSELSLHVGIHGQSQPFRRFRIGEDFGIFGMYLYPFAIPALFGIPATELSNQMPDLTAFFGRAGTELEERVMLAAIPKPISRVTRKAWVTGMYNVVFFQFQQ